MKPGEILMRTLRVAARECGQIARNPIYLFCMVVFPIVVTFFFTSILDEGQPAKLPVGVVDQDRSEVTRAMVRRLNSFQTTQVKDYYPSVADARKAIQRGEIYGFILFPDGMTADLLASKQPHVSFYYSAAIMLPGNLVFRDLKTITALGAASVGQAKLQMLGKSGTEIMSFLQPITIDLHMTGNPWSNYNIYLSSIMVPGIFGIFIPPPATAFIILRVSSNCFIRRFTSAIVVPLPLAMQAPTPWVPLRTTPISIAPICASWACSTLTA